MPAKGDIITAHNYLDIVFKLLREDALRPLREGILAIRKFITENKI